LNVQIALTLLLKGLIDQSIAFATDLTKDVGKYIIDVKNVPISMLATFDGKPVKPGRVHS